MKQIVQPLAGGPVEVLDVPRPVPDATEVLVRTVASVISPCTERAVTALAQASLLAKARARPDGSARWSRRHGRKDWRPPGRRSAATSPRICRWGTRRPESSWRPAGGDRSAARPAGGDRRRGQGQPRGATGRAGPALRDRARGRPCRGLRLHNDRLDRVARPAPGRGETWIESRGPSAAATGRCPRRSTGWSPTG